MFQVGGLEVGGRRRKGWSIWFMIFVRHPLICAEPVSSSTRPSTTPPGRSGGTPLRPSTGFDRAGVCTVSHWPSAITSGGSRLARWVSPSLVFDDDFRLSRGRALVGAALSWTVGARPGLSSDLRLRRSRSLASEDMSGDLEFRCTPIGYLDCRGSSRRFGTRVQMGFACQTRGQPRTLEFAFTHPRRTGLLRAGQRGGTGFSRRFLRPSPSNGDSARSLLPSNGSCRVPISAS